MSFKTAISAIVIVLLIHLVAIVTSFYYIWMPFDMVMHFFGGFAVGLLAVALTNHIGDEAPFRRFWVRFLFALGFVMIIGVFWEFLEFTIDHTLGLWYQFSSTQPSLSDTMSDLLMDCLGGIVVFLLFKNRR